MVYFAQIHDGGPIKIGTSVNVPQRMMQLASYYGRPLSLLATVDGGRDVEKEMHAKFAHLRLGGTEQFRPGPDLLAFIGKPIIVGANPDTVEAVPNMEGVRIRLVLSPADSERLGRVAARANRSKANHVQTIVLEHLDAAEPKDPKP